MAVTTTPIFAQTPKDKVIVTTGTAVDVAYAPTTQLTTVVTAGANGSRLYSITVIPSATVTAQAIVLAMQTAGAGTKVVFDIFTIPAYTSSATAPPPVLTHLYDGIFLAASTIIQAGQTVTTGACAVTGCWGDF